MYPGLEALGADIKEARKALGLTRRALAEKVSIDPRYLANIENSGAVPSVPVLYELANICRLPIERYFHPEAESEGSEQRQRVCGITIPTISEKMQIIKSILIFLT